MHSSPASLEFTPQEMRRMGDAVMHRLIEHLATIGEQPVRGDVDLVLPFRRGLVGGTVLSHAVPGEDGYALLFLSPPPASVTGFERFIAWTHRERGAGRYACFAVVPDGETAAVGIFQVRLLEGRDGVAEWGFILGAAYWGTGRFLAGAQRVVDFAFEQMGLHRLEARASVANGRGNGALAKLGAVREAVLRQSFERHGAWYDQVLWGLGRENWWAARTECRSTRH